MFHVNVVLQLQGTAGVLDEMIVNGDDVLRSIEQISTQDILDVWQSFHQGQLGEDGGGSGGLGRQADITVGTPAFTQSGLRVFRELIL